MTSVVQVRHSWGDKREARRLFYFLNTTMEERSSASYLWAAMTELTPSAMDILLNPTGGIRNLNDKISRLCFSFAIWLLQFRKYFLWIVDLLDQIELLASFTA